MTNAFTSKQPSQVLKALGRTKSAQQIKKDATRVNPYSELAVSTSGAGNRADQIRRGGK
jgi:hypothetical protein